MGDKLKRVIAIIIVIILVASCVASIAIPVLAKENTNTKEYVVLGGDLTEKEERKVIRLMGASKNTKKTKISHKREVKELKKYLTMKYIGDIAVSSTYIKKAESGLHLKTININYVTNTMYHNIMSTLGMKNVEVTIAAPEPTFGSCAILGLIDGYEKVSGEKISNKRKELSFKEMRMTIDLNKKYGKRKGTNFWNRLKTRVINSRLTDYNECKAITRTMASLSDVDLTKSEITSITKIMTEMAKYIDKKDIKEEFKEFSISNKKFGVELEKMIKQFKKDTRERTTLSK